MKFIALFCCSAKMFLNKCFSKKYILNCVVQNSMETPKKIIAYVVFCLTALPAIYAAEHAHDKKSLFNRITVQYHPSIAKGIPIAVGYKTMKLDKRLQTNRPFWEMDQKNTHPVKSYLMLKELDKSSSLFTLHVPHSDKKFELITAEDGDHYCVSYVGNGKECYLLIGKDNRKNGVANYEFLKFSLLMIKSNNN
jgi:hypothetical protein